MAHQNANFYVWWWSKPFCQWNGLKDGWISPATQNIFSVKNKNKDIKYKTFSIIIMITCFSNCVQMYFADEDTFDSLRYNMVHDQFKFTLQQQYLVHVWKTHKNVI